METDGVTPAVPRLSLCQHPIFRPQQSCWSILDGPLPGITERSIARALSACGGSEVSPRGQRLFITCPRVSCRCYSWHQWWLQGYLKGGKGRRRGSPVVALGASGMSAMPRCFAVSQLAVSLRSHVALSEKRNVFQKTVDCWKNLPQLLKGSFLYSYFLF